MRISLLLFVGATVGGMAGCASWVKSPVDIQVFDRATGEPAKALLVMSHGAEAMGLPPDTYTTTDLRGRASMTALISKNVGTSLYVNDQIYMITNDLVQNGGEAPPAHSPNQARFTVIISPGDSFHRTDYSVKRE